MELIEVKGWGHVTFTVGKDLSRYLDFVCEDMSRGEGGDGDI